MDSDLQAEIVRLLDRAAAYLGNEYEDGGQGEHWLAKECRDMKARIET